MKLTTLVLLVPMAWALLSACGGNDNSGASPATEASRIVEITAKDVKFTPDKVVIRSGEMVELRLKNEDAQQHDLQVTGLDVEVMGGGATGAEHQMQSPEANMEMPAGEMGPIAMHTTANGQDSITFIATEKGTYELWCTISGHKEAGMVGTLTVE